MTANGDAVNLATMVTAEDDLVDITAVVEKCAASLTHENAILCNRETFDLHDSMAALELMDRKMDCCEIPASVAKGAAAAAAQSLDDEDMVPPRPLPTGLDDVVAPLPWKELTWEDASVIAVEALMRLESMLSGASVSESIYTCLYAHNAVLEDMKSRIRQGDSTTAQQAVYGIALALVAVARVFRDTVLQADIYEEEDFSVQMYGLEFLNGILSVECFLDMENGVRCAAADAEGGRTVELVLRFELEFLKACVSMVS